MHKLSCTLASFRNHGYQVKFKVNSEPATILEFLAEYDGTNCFNTLMMNRQIEGIKKYLIISIAGPQKRKEAAEAIVDMSDEEAIRFLMKAAGKRVLKSGLWVPTEYLF